MTNFRSARLRHPPRKHSVWFCFSWAAPILRQAVEPFLYNLFCDPDIINFPLAWLARRPLARYIARRRARVVREHYDAIGGHSPIRLLTERQARKLEAALAPDFDVRCWVAMRYWHPLTAETARGGARRVSRRAGAAAALSALFLRHHGQQPEGVEARLSYGTGRPGGPSGKRARNWSKNFIRIRCISRRWRRGSPRALRISTIPRKVHLVFSAHGLPLSLIAKGDPYQRQVEETVRAVMARGGWPNAHTLCYQSRVGRQKWLEPSLESDDRATGCSRRKASAGDSDLVCHRAYRDPARDQYRGARSKPCTRASSSSR